MASLSFSIQQAEDADIEILARLSEDAMGTDTQTLFKHLAGDGAVTSRMMEEPLKVWLVNSKCRVLKAVDNMTSEILGWTCWAFRGYDMAEQVTSSTASTDTSEKAQDVPMDAVARLERFTGDDFAAWMEELMPEGTRCMFVCSISVHPRSQGRGIGKALIQWGTSRADKDGVFCWVHASEAGCPVFVSQGYGVNRILEIDLDEYARDVENEEVRGRKWGLYTLRYMVRQPKITS